MKVLGDRDRFEEEEMEEEIPEQAPPRKKKLPLLVRLLLLCFCAGCCLFAFTFGGVLSGAKDSVTGEPPYMIVLGCSVKPWGPSILLQDRLNRALDWWEDHQDVRIVVTGAQGPDEPETEASAMADYLTERGVPEDQIILEDRSSNTIQNLRNAAELLEEEDYDIGDGVLVVSNSWHLTRVRMLAGRAGYGHVSLLAAPSSHIPSLLKMLVREPIAMWKSIILDR